MRHNTQQGLILSARLIVGKELNDKSKARRTDERGEEIGSSLVTSETDAA
jgi:hypothetical protein